MTTLTQVRQALGHMLDELSPFMPRTIVAGTVTNGTGNFTVQANRLMAMPNDDNLFTGGYFYDPATSNVFYCTAYAQAPGLITLTPNVGIPATGATLEYWKNWDPTQINAAILNAYNELYRKIWVPIDATPWTIREGFRQNYGLPSNWTGVYRMQFGGYPVAYPADVDHYTAISSVGTQFTWTPATDAWLRFIAVNLRAGSSTAGGVSITVTGTSVNSTTSTIVQADIAISPQWAVLDLGNPVKFSQGQTYTFTLTTTASPTPDVAVDASGVPLIALYRAQAGWVDTLGTDWELEPDRKLRIKDEHAYSVVNPSYLVPQFSMIRLLGIRSPVAPNDTEGVIELPYDLLVYKTAYELSASRIQAASIDPQVWGERIKDWGIALQDALGTAVKKKPSGTRLIKDNQGVVS